MRIEESLKSKVVNPIDFAISILKNKTKIKGKPRVYYSLRKYKNMVSCNICTYMIEHLTLVQLMGSLVNVNHTVSVVGYWIFDPNY